MPRPCSLAAQRGLGDVQHAGGARETAQFGDAHEVFELFEVHALRDGLSIIMPKCDTC